MAPQSHGPLTPLDHQRLLRTLELAERAIGLSDPNPRVGCVLGLEDGTVVAEGSTQRAGFAHAEADALARAAEAGTPTQGATAWVSLEPCSHQGRTPPCCDALIKAGVARVVIAIQDPNPLVAGQGAAKLRAAGIQVVWASAEIEAQAREINVGFFSRMQRGLPWVRLKVAASLDGRTALDNGASQWITDTAARTDGHAWRRRAGAVLTGIGTVLEDNPRLDVRLVPTAEQPWRVIIDSRLQTPLSARILPPPGKVRVYTALAQDTNAAAALQALGVDVVSLPNAEGKVALDAVLKHLAQAGVNELHVEAGHKLNGSFLREGLVDELLVYLAPKLLGAGRDMAAFGPLASLQEAQAYRFTHVDRVGPDLRLRLRARKA
jgi:diaminohydroxyphosphoribosylaminopyrimidine deaminase / 5-amino-6-(5-phosphoribosylamino)uracil reductase